MRRHRRFRILLALALAYALLAYLVLPDLWFRYERHKVLTTLPLLTRNADDIPGDPINVGLIGTQDEIIRSFHAAGWSPANAITLRSSIGIVESVVLDRADPDAPVSRLFFQGRPEDLAFEKPDGTSADRRHHVRFWSLPRPDGSAPLWLGSASFDRGVGFSHYTGAVTHHISPDVDAERDGLVKDLVAAGAASIIYRVAAEAPITAGRNAEGDPYSTDGKIVVVRLAAERSSEVVPREVDVGSLQEMAELLEDGSER